MKKEGINSGTPREMVELDSRSISKTVNDFPDEFSPKEKEVIIRAASEIQTAVKTAKKRGI